MVAPYRWHFDARAAEAMTASLSDPTRVQPHSRSKDATLADLVGTVVLISGRTVFVFS